MVSFDDSRRTIIATVEGATIGGNILGNNIPVLPAEFVTETADCAVLAAGLETQDTQSLGNNDTLLAVVGSGHTLKGLEAVQGSGAARSLVRQHATDSAPEHLGGLAVMPWATTSSVVTGLLAHEGLVVHWEEFISCRLDTERRLVMFWQ